jgi:hypothetical protein
MPGQGQPPPQFGGMPGQGQPPPQFGGMNGGPFGGSAGAPQLGNMAGQLSAYGAGMRPQFPGVNGGALGDSMGTPQMGVLDMLMRGGGGQGRPSFSAAGPSLGARGRMPPPGSTGPVRRSM